MREFRKYLSRYCLAATLCVLSVYAACLSIRGALADTSSLRCAIRLDPGNARLHLALAEQLDLSGLDARPALQQAAGLDPYLASSWIALGLLAEGRGDERAAEASLLHAARVNRQLLPRKALMGYYYRRNLPDPFWHWARKSFEVAYGDSTDLFDLCWEMANSPLEIYARAVPPRRDVLRAYIRYLLDHRSAADAEQPVLDLLTQALPEDRDLAVSYCDRLLPDSPSAAARIWNAACRHALLPYPPFAEGPGTVIVNPEFRYPLLGKAFDWKVAAFPALASVVLPAGGIELSLNGRQPEDFQLLTQLVSLPAGRRQLYVEYQTAGLPAPTGLAWLLEDANTHQPLAITPIPPSSSWARQFVAVDLPQPRICTVSLLYRRPVGSTRAEGQLSLRKVGLEVSQNL
jgi:hypothetical protein